MSNRRRPAYYPAPGFTRTGRTIACSENRHPACQGRECGCRCHVDPTMPDLEAEPERIRDVDG